ncbi:HNH endonuclease [Nakamurella sp. DB0629]|uniref:HNH endonuclease n=1 Tax=Nakamurella aerolata TaxID=1656892 RepID=A0A849AD53_9ACTN|nr:HNH endonuclease [Nakamurella aerolata]NNG37131.1 HNH endonuclease [Nakamurella aerolata]
MSRARQPRSPRGSAARAVRTARTGSTAAAQHRVERADGKSRQPQAVSVTDPRSGFAAGPDRTNTAALAPRGEPPSAKVRVLLLNATHEPLAVVTGRRALVLLLAGKAESVADRDTAAPMRSPTLVLAVPAVVRLNRFVRVPYHRATSVTRSGVLRRDRRICAYCGGRADTIDHVQPRSRGGAHSWENCVACCVRCNSRKADRLLSELGWTLPFVPAPPVRAGNGRVWLTDDTDPAWDPWLAGAA